MQERKQDIRTLTLPQLQEQLVAMGEKKFRAKQVYEWLWQKSAHSFSEMTNLSLSLRQTLESSFELHSIENAFSQTSNDGTIKSAFPVLPHGVIQH